MMKGQEFQAVVLAAGHGSRLPEVLGDNPKCLLPIGPYPLLWYPLNLLQQHNFQEALVVVLENEKSEIQQALEHTLKIKLDFVTIPDQDFGTADSLRHIHDRIKSDFIVLSCDIVTNASLYPLINKFRQHDATVTAMVFKGGFEADVTVPGPKIKYKPERDLIGIHPDTGRLLLLTSMSDFEDVVSVNGHLLRKYEKIQVFSRHVDSHIYVMKRWVLDILSKKEQLSTLKSEFLPYIIKKQMSKHTGVSLTSQEPQSEYGVTSKLDSDVYNKVPHTKLQQHIQKTSLFNDSLSKEPYHGDFVRCYVIESPKDALGIRVNTTQNFFAVNRKLNMLWPEIGNEQLTTKEGSILSKNAVVNSTQTTEIIVADGAHLLEKTSLRHSMFGPNCQVMPKNIVNNSILLSHAIVEEGCNIDNCIIGSRAIVKKGSHLKNCLIGAGYVVEENSKEEMKYFSKTEDLMEFDIQ